MAESAVGNSSTTPITGEEASLRTQSRGGVPGCTPDLIPKETELIAPTPQATQLDCEASTKAHLELLLHLQRSQEGLPGR